MRGKERSSIPPILTDKDGAISERQAKPWEKLGISKRTYYYHKKAGKLSQDPNQDTLPILTDKDSRTEEA